MAGHLLQLLERLVLLERPCNHSRAFNADKIITEADKLNQERQRDTVGGVVDRKSRSPGPGSDSLQPQERLVKREGLSNGRRALVANAAGC